MQAITKNGISTTTKPGQEQYEIYFSDVLRKNLCQYDYRHTDGTLFSIVRDTLEKCIAQRDVWLAKKNLYK